MAAPRRKACVECRQQKIRCDVEQHKTPHDPCTRCQKMGLECRILPTSTRNLRQTKAEMRRELEDLKWNMRHGAESSHMMATPTSHTDSIDAPHYSPPAPGPGSYSNTSARTEESVSMSPHQSGGSGPPTGPRTDPHTHPAILPRALEGYAVDAKRIEDCFTLYFRDYHEMLPILDPSLSPNEFYDTSPFLFWSIIVTGSRRYTEDPTILDKTSQLITPLAFSSMALRSTPIPVIQGLLILCTWRLPTNSMYKDMTHVLCGAAVHLATQIGLHVAGVGQDFARMPIKKDQDQAVFRAKLWMQCVIASISCAEGIPPLVIAESFFEGDEREREDVLARIPEDLQFLHKLHIILLRAMSAMVKTNLQSPDCDVGVLRSLISIFDSQLQGLASSSPSEMDTFQLNCARIHVLSFHFFASPSSPVGPDMESLGRLFSLCISTLGTATTLCQNTNFITQCPSFVDRTMTLTGFAILRLVRSPLAQHLSLTAGEQAFFQAVQFSKNMSLQNNDLGARAAAILMNLWSSNKVFRRRDGHVEPLGLRLRTRLSMSVSFDMFWYWREEFGNLSNPYNGEDTNTSVQSKSATQPATPHLEHPIPHLPPPDPTTSTAQSQSTLDPSLSSVPKLPPPMDTMSMQPIPTSTIPAMNFPGTWEMGDYSVPTMIDQFPDYDWATSFDFNVNGEWPNPALAMPPENVGYAPMNFG
ncbi:C6 zinc finger domain-containing protein [Lophiostoma macrostomum CBS 122681]|uniref:C6 zinc finger domain-containing protein n=1 Tax=Lophiostoma macrostomum CBS 122681 TaxID=1314788 RepID=A0A6A6TKH7_9PLEO|nr:C6 zinc finger domain-containing protein [Lophiostoma macrostomum CBS 122681]